MRMTVGHWQTRLEEEFLHRNSGCLVGVIREEERFYGAVHYELAGHVALLDSFHVFLCQTLEAVLTEELRHGVRWSTRVPSRFPCTYFERNTIHSSNDPVSRIP